jgi:hypothetical protein
MNRSPHVAEKTTFTCDVCGKTKQETNHWWILGSTIASTYDNDTMVSAFLLLPWESGEMEFKFIRGPLQHLCGAECAQKKLSEFLGVKR